MLNNINYNLVLIGNPKLPHMCFFTEQLSKFRRLLQKGLFLSETLFVRHILNLCLFLKTPNSRETQFHAGGGRKDQTRQNL